VERLEEALGAKLLERTTRHVQLTAIGQEFLTEARAALESLETAAQRISDQALTRRGSVTVACIPSVANHLLPNALRAFADEYPDVQVHVIDENASHVLDAVVRGRADFGLSFTGSQEPEFSSRHWHASDMCWRCCAVMLGHAAQRWRGQSLPECVSYPYHTRAAIDCFWTKSWQACSSSQWLGTSAIT
jgi:DNA-binding transcriptional LysR family regulator